MIGLLFIKLYFLNFRELNMTNQTFTFLFMPHVMNVTLIEPWGPGDPNITDVTCMWNFNVLNTTDNYTYTEHNVTLSNSIPYAGVFNYTEEGGEGWFLVWVNILHSFISNNRRANKNITDYKN